LLSRSSGILERLFVKKITKPDNFLPSSPSPKKKIKNEQKYKQNRIFPAETIKCKLLKLSPKSAVFKTGLIIETKAYLS